MSYSLSEIKKIKETKKPTASDYAILRELRYELTALVSFYETNDKQKVDLETVRYNNLSINDYLSTLSKRDLGENSLSSEDVEAIYNALDAASVYCFGQSLREEKSPETIIYRNQISGESNFEQVLYYMLTYLAVNIPVKFSIYKEYWKGNNFSDYANAVEKMEQDRDALTLAHKICDDNISYIYNKKFEAMKDNKKSPFDEVDAEIQSYQQYIIDKHIKSIDRMERKADKIRYKKVHPSFAKRFKNWIKSFQNQSDYNPETDNPHDRHNW